MWVEKRKDNRYKFVEQYRDPLTDKKKRVSITYDKNTSHTRKEAQLLLEKRVQDKLKHAQDGTIKKGVTLGEVVKEWTPIYKAKVRISTYEAGLKHLSKLQQEIPFDTLVSKLNDRLIANVIENMLYKENYTTPYAKMILSKINALLKHSYQKGYIATLPHPTDLIEWKPYNKKGDISKKYLDDDELKKTLRYIAKRSQVQADVLEWEYLSGMRIGEILSLRLNDLTRVKNVYDVHVHRTMYYVGQRLADFIFKNYTKTDSGFRHVIMPAKANSIIKRNTNGKSANDLLFTSGPNNRPVNPPNINYNLKKAKTDLKIDKTLTTHTFRHTHVSKLAEMGIPLYIISDRVGHSGSAITQQIYLHITKKARMKYNSQIVLLK